MELKSSIIINAEVFPVLMSTKYPCLSSIGSCNSFIRTIVKIETNDRIIGWGETYGDYCLPYLHNFIQRIKNKPINSKTIVDNFQLTHTDFGILQMNVKLNNQIILLLRMALLDIEAKRLKVPLCKYLNIDNDYCFVPFVTYSYAVSKSIPKEEIPQKMAERALKLLEKNPNNYFEFKVGVHGVDCDIQTVKAVRQAVGDSVKLSVDANMAWSLEEAKRFINGVLECNLHVIEEPVGNIFDMDKLASEFNVNISTHCTDANILKQCKNIYGSVPDLHFDLNPKNNCKKVWFRSCLELGISFSAMVHFAIANPMDRSHQSLYHLIKDDLCDTSLILVDNGYKLSTNAKPGLGIEINLEKLNKYHQRYKSMKLAPSYYG